MNIIERDSFTIGEESRLTRQISDDDIHAFANLIGDHNPIHINDEYASGTRFGKRIAHGLLIASLISNVLGNDLPGPGAIYIEQHLNFLAPIYIDEKVTVTVKVIDWNSIKGHVKLVTNIFNQDNVQVISGQARLVMSAFIQEK